MDLVDHNRRRDHLDRPALKLLEVREEAAIEVKTVVLNGLRIKRQGVILHRSTKSLCADRQCGGGPCH